MAEYTVERGKGYEVSTKGDKRFSPFNAILPDGRSIETTYQCDTKRIQPGGTDWRVGKSKPPLDTTVDLWSEYLNLWSIWSKHNPWMIRQLRLLVKPHDNKLSDIFGHTEVNQARALSVILKETEEQPMYYSGVGSRETPLAAMNLLSALAASLGKKGYILRSGAAEGADSAFEKGCDAVQGKKEIYLPWKGFNQHTTGIYQLPTDSDHERIASELHPAWSKLSQGAKKLHTRNVAQILGADCETPSLMCVCYTDDGVEHHSKVTYKTGGTGTAIRLASQRGIPVFNLRNPTSLEKLKQHVNSMI